MVNYISGFNISVSGYSTLPSNIGDASDGVVIDHYSVNNNVLTHETGHYLGLMHTFTGGCINNNCLLDGDYICDTPPDTSTNICRGNSCSSDMNDTSGFNPFIADVDELPNYMDYTPCPLSFSQGQADRMNYSLTAIRYQLLQSVGCGFNGGALPVANLISVVSPCNDGVVHFYDSLSSNVITINYDFNNDRIFDSFIHNPVYTYPATGTYTVKLIVTGPGGIDTVSQSFFIQKGSSQFYPIVSMGSVFQYPPGTWNTCNNYVNNLSGPPNAQSYLWSTGDTTQAISFSPSANYSISLTIIDSAGLTWTNQLCNPFTVNVIAAPPIAFVYTNDPINICDGDTVNLHAIIDTTGNNVYTWYENGGWGTGVHDSVFHAIGFAYGVQYQVVGDGGNGCYSWSNVIYVNSFSPPITQSLTQNGMVLTTGWGGGNQWYRDGVAIPGATGMTYTVTQNGCYQDNWYSSWAPACTTMSDSICFTTVGIYQFADNNMITIFPNPFTFETTITFAHQQKNTTVIITDVLGKELKSVSIAGKKYIIANEGMSKGIYFVKIIDDKNKVINRKIILE